jgi:antitoxin VapB
MGMIALSPETEALAQRFAAAQNLSVEAAIAMAVKTQARLAGVEPGARKARRMTFEQMMAIGAEIAAMPLLDARTSNEIVDDINAI